MFKVYYWILSINVEAKDVPALNTYSELCFGSCAFIKLLDKTKQKKILHMLDQVLFYEFSNNESKSQIVKPVLNYN